jgi:hypothetical protein
MKNCRQGGSAPPTLLLSTLSSCGACSNTFSMKPWSSRLESVQVPMEQCQNGMFQNWRAGRAGRARRGRGVTQ